MPVQEVGVRAVFETSTFTAGLNRYIAGLDKANQKTAEIVAAINAMAAHFNQQEDLIGQGADKASAALGKVTQAAKDAMNAVKAARSAGTDTPEDGQLTELQRQLEVQRQIKNEIRDRISEQKQALLLTNAETTELTQGTARAELEMIKLFRDLRDIGAPNLGVDPGTFQKIRDMEVALSDIGNQPKNQTKDAAAELRVQNEEVRDRVRLEQIANSLVNDRLTALQRERLEIERIGIEIAQETRLTTAQNINGGNQNLVDSIRAIRQIPVEQADLGGLTTDESRLRVNRLMSQEIRDRIRLQQIDDQLASGQTSILQSNLLNLERQNVVLAQQQRLNSELLSQEDQEAIARLRSAQPTAADLGITQSDALKQQVSQLNLIQEELSAQLELKRLSLLLTNSETSAFEREQASIARATLELEAQQRVLAATKVGLSQQALTDVKRVAITPQDLGTTQTDPLQKAVDLNRSIQELLQNRVALEAAITRSQDQELTEIQRTTAALQAGNLVLEQQQKLAEFTKLGGDPAQLQAVNSLLVTNADLNINVNAQLDKQIGAQRLLLEEVAARVELERQNKILLDGQSTALQRQAAAGRISELSLEAQARSAKAGDLGVGPDQLDRIRQTAVASRDLGEAQKDASAGVKALSAAAIVQTTILTQFAVNALQSMIQNLRQMSGQIITTVSDFERLGLGIAFFAAKTKFGTESTLTYQQRLAGVTDEVVGLQFWLQKLAVASPFTTKEVTQLFRTAQAYGLTQAEAEKLLPLMVDMGAAGGLDSDVMERLALALGQVRARGKLTGEEIRQLGNSGVPIRDILVTALGIANDQFDKLVESGALTSDIVIPAIIKGLEQFRGAGEAVAFGTIGGLVSGLRDLQEIATSKFFGGALNPLKDSFKEFFDFLNKPSTMATVQVLGKELGGELLADFKSLSNAIKDTIKWLSALDPDVVAQVITFTALAAILLTTAGAFGLLLAAIGLISNPIVGLSLLAALLLTEWTRMMRGLVSVTSAAARGLGSLLLDLGKFGFATASAWGRGFASAAKVVSSFVSAIGGVLTFWLKPHSPPKVAPDLDKWGRETGEFWLTGVGAANPEQMVKGLSKSVQDGLQEVSSRAISAKFNPAPHILKPLRDALGATKDTAAAAGIEASQAFVDAFGSLVPKFKAKVDPDLTQALLELGSGAQLSEAGANAFTSFLAGFKSADFGALNDAVGIVDTTLRGLVERGAITEGDALRGLFAAREDIAGALREFRQFGSISQATLNQIVDSSGAAGSAVKDLLLAYTQFAHADDILTSAQKNLTAVTDKYNDILKPLKAQLERISELRQLSDEDQQIASLKRLIANQDVSEFRKQNARLKIAEILQQRQVRGIEDEQKAQTDTANETIKAAQKKHDAAQENLDLVKSQIQAQQDQLGLFNQEAALVKKLRDQVDQLTKKQMTDLDLQEKLVGLRSAELDDNKKAAKAKFVLNQADSSQLEKQNAIFDLQNVAISRQQRLVEARDLGIPPEQLTSLRDMAVTLNDIGEKADLGLGGNLDALAQAQVDAAAEGKKWNLELAAAQTNIDNIKIKLGEMFTIINDNLPTWFKIFPEKPGEDPPIIQTIDKYSGAILFLGGVIIASRVVSALGTILSLFGWLGGIGGATAAGAAAGGAITTGVGAGGVIEAATASTAAFGTELGLLGAAIVSPLGLLLGLAGAIWGVTAAFQALQGTKTGDVINKAATGPISPDEMRNAVNNNKPLSLLPDNFGTWDWIAQLWGGNNAIPGKTPQAIKATDLITKMVTGIVNSGVDQGLDATSIRQDVFDAMRNGIQQGMLPDDAQLRTSAINYMESLISAYKTAGRIKSPSDLSRVEVGQPFGQGIIDGAIDVLDIESSGKGALGQSITTLLRFIKQSFFGNSAATSLPYILGQSWVVAFADGIISQQQTLSQALNSTLQFALLGAQQTLGLLSNAGSRQPSSVFANSPVTPRASQIYPGGTTIINNVRYFNLTVQTAAQSQGVIRDFGIMETLSGT